MTSGQVSPLTPTLSPLGRGRAGRALPGWFLDFGQACGALRIRDKDSKLVGLEPNAQQRKVMGMLSGRDIVLKARQVGVSTVVDAKGYHQSITVPGTRGVIVAHERAATMRLKQRIDLMHRELPAKPKAEYDSKAELAFSGIDSTIYIGTAGGRSFGRGDTVHWAHCSEVAFWPSLDTLTGLQEAVTANGWVVIESTPNGFNFFYQLVRDALAGLNGYRLIFLPWFLHGEYRAQPGIPRAEWDNDEVALAGKALAHGVQLDGEQVAWRRAKRASLKKEGQSYFEQEYPEDVQSCFLTSGNPRFDNARLNAYLVTTRAPMRTEMVKDSQLAVRVWEEPEPDGVYVIGADSSEGKVQGDCDAACVLNWRTGRKAAGIHGRGSLFQYAECLKLVGMRYNAATLAVERRHPGPAVLAKLVELRYPNLFYHTDDRGVRVDEPGFDTNTYWRPLLVDALDQAISRGTPDQWPDEMEIGECMSFVAKASKSEAADGAHDDLVMARGIATKVRELVKPMEQRRGPESGRRPMGGQR